MSRIPSAKDHRIDLRVTQEQKELIEKAAAQEKIVLSDRDRDLLISVLENPPELNGKLKAAIDHYRNTKV